MKYYSMLDVGGTQIKAGLLDQKGQLVEKELSRYPSQSELKKDPLLDYLAEIILHPLGEKSISQLQGVGLAFPGPFDYAAGISQISGLAKYASLYQVNVKEELRKRLAAGGRPVPPFVFLNDVEAFARGISRYGEAKPYDKVFVLAVGTGAGSAFLQAGQVLKEDPHIPENGWIYSTPFGESILDDYISARGLAALSLAYFPEEQTGLQLYQLAQAGNQQALAVFSQFGENLLQGVKEFLLDFQPDAFVLGGQIAGSFSYFGQPLTTFCNQKNIQIILSKQTSLLSFYGLYSAFLET